MQQYLNYTNNKNNTPWSRLLAFPSCYFSFFSFFFCCSRPQEGVGKSCSSMHALSNAKSRWPSSAGPPSPFIYSLYPLVYVWILYIITTRSHRLQPIQCKTHLYISGEHLGCVDYCGGGGGVKMKSFKKHVSTFFLLYVSMAVIAPAQSWFIDIFTRWRDYKDTWLINCRVLKVQLLVSFGV